MIKYCIFILTFTLLFGLTSCSTILLQFYGTKKIKEVDEKTILKISKKYNIPLADNYILDSSYLTFLYSFDTIKYKVEIKNHYQPLQALYFDKSLQLKSYLINCYASGFPNLNWNKDNNLNTFPPKQHVPIDNLLQLDNQLKYLKPFSQSNPLNINSFDFIVVIYWNKFMGRQSKRLIRFVQQNCKLSKDNVKIIYANNDNIFANKKQTQ